MMAMAKRHLGLATLYAINGIKYFTPLYDSQSWQATIFPRNSRRCSWRYDEMILAWGRLRRHLSATTITARRLWGRYSGVSMSTFRSSCDGSLTSWDWWWPTERRSTRFSCVGRSGYLRTRRRAFALSSIIAHRAFILNVVSPNRSPVRRHEKQIENTAIDARRWELPEAARNTLHRDVYQLISMAPKMSLTRQPTKIS